MRTFIDGSMLVFLMVCAVIDIRKRSLPVWILWMGTILAVSGGMWIHRLAFPILVKGAIPGSLFLIVSKVTGEAIGYADTWMILILGIYLGLWDVIGLVGIAFFLCSVISAVYLYKRRFGRRTAVPFIPFLAAAYVGVMVL